VPAADALDEPLVDLADQALADRCAAREVRAHEVEGTAVVQQLAHVVGVRPLHLVACPDLLGLLHAELCALDVCRVVRVEQERTLAHAPHPLLGDRRGLQESARALDRRQRGGDAVRDGEAR
jgi:hypothetical protein